MPKFVPLTALKDTTGIVELCKKSGEPVFVTRNSIPEFVVMDSSLFDEHLRYRDEDGKLDILREFQALPVTVTIKGLKNTGEVSGLCRKTNEPISVIRNGYAELVLISLEGYEARRLGLCSWKGVQESF